MGTESYSGENEPLSEWMVHFKFLVNNVSDLRSISHPVIKQKILDELKDSKPILLTDNKDQWLSISLTQHNTAEAARTDAFLKTLSALGSAGFEHLSVWEARQLDMGPILDEMTTANHPAIDVTAEIMEIETALREFQTPSA